MTVDKNNIFRTWSNLVHLFVDILLTCVSTYFNQTNINICLSYTLTFKIIYIYCNINTSNISAWYLVRNNIEPINQHRYANHNCMAFFKSQKLSIKISLNANSLNQILITFEQTKSIVFKLNKSYCSNKLLITEFWRN